MKIIHSISTDQYDPISFDKNYLYNQYDKIISFVTKNYGVEFQNILSKPVLVGDTVDWYSNYNNPLRKLNEYAEGEKDEIKKKYWITINKIQKKITELASSNDEEKKEWSVLLNAVFNDDNNVIFSDGNEIVLLWGWKFNNRDENFLPPTFEESISQDKIPSSVNSNFQDPITIKSKNINDRVELANEDESKKRINRKLTFWNKLKRFLRRILYRYWRWIILILLLLIIMCLTKKCVGDNCNNCIEYDLLHDRMTKLKNKIDEKCNLKDTNEQKPDTTEIFDKRDTIVDGEQVFQPTNNCRAHFSGLLMSDVYNKNWTSKIWEVDESSEYVGEGEYPRAIKAFPKSHKATFDGIAVDKKTRVIIYEKPYFKGKILLDIIGPK